MHRTIFNVISLKVSLCLNKMQEKWERLKIPPAWKPDQWICHHSGNRQSSMSSHCYYHSWERKSTATSRNVETPVSSRRISTAKIRRRKFISKTRKMRFSFLYFRDRKFEFKECRIPSFCSSIENQTIKWEFQSQIIQKYFLLCQPSSDESGTHTKNVKTIIETMA